jgi:hypothetical protein
VCLNRVISPVIAPFEHMWTKMENEGMERLIIKTTEI